jgi:hypothetical protein
MSLETTAASLEEKLLDELQFNLKPGANYVTRRESVTMYPSGSGGYQYNSVKVIRIPLQAAAGQWLDPQTLNLNFDFKSNAPADVTSGDNQNRNRIKLNSGQHNIWSRLRILVGGQSLEDISYYNRLYDMYLKMAPESYLKNFTVQGPGILEPFPSQRRDYFQCREVSPGQVVTMSMPLICGLFMQPKWLPLRWLNPIIEIELCDPTIAVRSAVTGPSGNTVTYAGEYSIENVRVTCDLCTLDDSLENEMSKVLLSGRKMPLQIVSFTQTMHSLVPGDDAPTITSNRSVSRLKTAFLSFYASRPADGFGSEVDLFHHPLGPGSGTDATHPSTTPGNGSNGLAIDNSKQFQYQWLVNSEVFPVMPVRNSKEAWSQLTKALGQHNSTQHPLGISWMEYITTQHIIAQDFESIISAGFTGKSLRNNSNLSVQLSGLTLGGTISSSSANALRRAYMTLVYDVVVEISDSGCLVMD